MPTTNMKVKSGKSFEVKYRVAETLSSLTREAVEALAIRYLRTAARNFVLGKLNEAEPAISTNQVLRTNMITAGLGTPETVDQFFKLQGLVLEIPSEFTIPISELIPDSEGGRGKKAADIFSFEDKEEESGEQEVTN